MNAAVVTVKAGAFIQRKCENLSLIPFELFANKRVLFKLTAHWVKL